MAESAQSLLARRAPLVSPEAQLELLSRFELVREFDEAVREDCGGPLHAERIEVLQINVGKLCNQTCLHCHVDAGPDRRESMSRETFEHVLAALEKHNIPTVDITGGAPELNPHFRWFVEEAHRLGVHIMDRCNLTIIETPRNADLPEFLAAHDVEVVCSLPHYRALNTDRQRGDGVYARSVRALKKLNALGYGHDDPKRQLSIVTNPVGAWLPADQAAMERDWKAQLLRLHGIRFDNLYSITNMPISRYLEWLESSGNLEEYLEQLVVKFNPATVEGLMCRSMISVSWDGRLYDCDFNQMLELDLDESLPRTIEAFDAEKLRGRKIQTHRHCFGCTAGAGSSCGGNTAGS